jgi:hypothetical protein
MLKLLLGFILFAALALFVIVNGVRGLPSVEAVNAPAEAASGDGASATPNASAAQ